jgi:uncharacterized YkwD family protein
LNRGSRFFIFVLALSMVLGSMVTSLAADGFADVSTSHWACDAITEAVHYGIVSGYPDGTFRPNNKVSLAEFVKMAVVAKTGKDPGPSKTGYWFNSYRSAAIDAGLLDSVIAGDSEMMREITRYDAALILADALSGRELSMAEQISAISLFSDIKHSRHIDSLALVICEGLMTGYPDGTFRPAQSITRAEAVCVISRMTNESKRIKSSTDYKDSDIDVSEYIAEAFRLTNKEREKAGIPPLSYNYNLEKVAQAKAEDMCKNDYFDHNSPTYGTPFEMISAFNISYSWAGENIAYNYRTPEEVIKGWMSSKGHRENLLRKEFTDVAFGFFDGGPLGIYWVQLFIKP